MSLTNGTRLGPYEIVSPLGAGGMGEVYRARDPRLGREVAIKVLPEGLARNPEALLRFEREARAVASLSHPNILAIHDFGSEQGVLYAVTELLEGESLRARLAGETLPWRKAVEITASVADGLAAAHAKGIIHRDLKPENIFLTSDGRVKILDFGLARVKPAVGPEESRAAPTESDPGKLMGTVAYMSPEQLCGVSAEAPSDLFSLGSVLYEMLTGRHPFARSTPAQTIAAILKESPDPLDGASAGIPPELEQVTFRGLEKRPGERFQSASDLAFALRAASGTGSAAALTAPKPVSHRLGAAIAAAMALALLATLLYLFTGGPQQTVNSIAVLPLATATHPDAEYLGDGITEGLINSLSQIPGLRVIARTTVFRYKGLPVDAAKIGRELNVRVLLTGRIAVRGDLLTIQADLVDAASGSQLWGQQYNRKLSDMITIQQEIARDITEKLQVRLAVQQRDRLAKPATSDPQAYQNYLMGRYHWNKRTPAGLRKAIEHFELAIQSDPRYAAAYAGLADCYNLQSMYAGEPPRDSFPKAKQAVTRALEIDDRLAEAHTARANALALFEWDWVEAERAFRRAIEVNPGYATAHHSYAFYLAAMGRVDEALREIRRAQQLDPLSLIIRAAEARILYGARRYDQAAEQVRKTFELDPNFIQAHLVLGDGYLKQGMHQEALAAYERAMALAGGSPATTPELLHAWAITGRRDDVLVILDQIKKQLPQKYVSPYDLALVYTGLGDRDQAMEWLEKAYQDRSDSLVYLKIEPMMDPLRSDPRFQNLLKRMGL